MAPLNILQVFLLFVLGQGLFLFFVLLTHKRGDRKANKILALSILLMTYYTFVFFLNDSGYRRYTPILFINGFSIAPLIPVMFYFYFNQVSIGKLGKNYFLHFIPFILQFIYWFPNNTNGLLFTISDSTYATYYSTTIVRIVSGIHILLFILYNYLFLTKFKFDGNLHAEPTLKWLIRIRILFTVLVVIFSIGTISIWLSDSGIARYIFNFFLAFFIYLIGYYGYVQPVTIFSAAKKLKPKYFHSKLTPSQSLRIYSRLIDLMNHQKLYLNPSVKLSDLANRVETSPHHLSRVINENCGTNFLDFINKYRVEEAKKILSSDKGVEYKMFAVALDAGFGNKVSFYKNFKKFTGDLPSKFRNQQVE